MVAKQQQNQDRPDHGDQHQPSWYASGCSASGLLDLTVNRRPWEGRQIVVARTPGGRHISHARQVTRPRLGAKPPAGGSWHRHGVDKPPPLRGLRDPVGGLSLGRS